MCVCACTGGREGGDYKKILSLLVKQILQLYFPLLINTSKLVVISLLIVGCIFSYIADKAPVIDLK